MDVRVSDQDRDRAAAEIREHFAAGRLTADELSERMSVAYTARTEADLRAARRELPQLPATRAQARAELVQRRRDLTRRLLQQSGAGLGVFALCTAIWAVDGASGSFWPVWVLALVLAPLIRNGWRMYGPAPELDRVERHLLRLERGDDDDDSRRRHRRR